MAHTLGQQTSGSGATARVGVGWDQMCSVQMTARDGKLTENKTKKKQKLLEMILSHEKRTHYILQLLEATLRKEKQL